MLADERPEPGFEPAAPDLEDVYFSALAADSRRSGRHAEGNRPLRVALSLAPAVFLAACALFFLLGFALTATGFGPDNVLVTRPGS